MSSLHAKLSKQLSASMEDGILAAAETIFATVGFEDARVDAIAAAAGVSRKTLFNRFNSKESILLAVLKRVSSRHKSELNDTEDLRFGDARDALPQFVQRRLGEIAKMRWILVLCARHAGLYDPAQPEADLFVDDRVLRTRRVAAAQAQGSIRADLPADEIARHFDMIRNAIYRRWLLGEEESTDALVAAFDTAVKIYLHGIAARPTVERA